jgi:deazaflavin-dependent oxidoreductase (nitroreductase family)
MTVATSARSRALAATTARLLGTRWLMRIPIWLYRARLGFLLGSRMLMLEHTGRRTGARRRVVLEVIDRPEPGTYLVVSGFGERSQWFRNVLAHPAVRISVGTRSALPAEARRLTPTEADAALASYATRHPRAWQAFKPTLETTLGAPITTRDTRLPVVAIQVRP